MTELTDFLLARISEDEAVAREAGEWAVGSWYVERSESGVLASARVPVAFDPRGYTGNARTHLDHIARHDPARVLAECEAKRQIVKLHTPRTDGLACSTCGGYTAKLDDVRGITHHGYAIPWPCPTLRSTATIYRDHPEFRAEWAGDAG